MGMAGWKTDEMIAGLPGVMNLAAASGEDLGRVSDIVTDAMTSFKLSASDAVMFSDVLAATATSSNTNVGKMGYTFQYVAPLAGALGYTIQDTALAIGAMADAGIKGEQAGTSLRALLTRLSSPTKDSANAMAKLGLSITDSAGKMRPLRDILSDIRKGFKNLTPAEQAQVAADLAGQDAVSGLLGIVNETDDKYNSLAESIDKSAGAAKRMADIRMDNLAGDLEYLSGDWDAFTMSLMKGAASTGLRGFVQEADKLLSNFSGNVEVNGLGVRSILSLIGDSIKDLKDRFLAFDVRPYENCKPVTACVRLFKKFDEGSVFNDSGGRWFQWRGRHDSPSTDGYCQWQYNTRGNNAGWQTVAAAITNAGRR